MEKYNEIKSILENSITDFEKFYEKGNNAAGTRVRKAMNELKKKAQEIRKDISDRKGANKESKKGAVDVQDES